MNTLEEQLKTGRAGDSTCAKARYDRPTARLIAFQDSGRLQEEIRAYQCRHCGWWHVGHAPGTKHIESLVKAKKYIGGLDETES